ncbi:hypothetical protein IQ216_11160 [Cyanobium sp. LEGE 06143]|uniref:hypothetical protein n=1 Tax=Cyanobium sp. LEGE 06143 TaxID=945727 RepID=UPI0018828230|nr:hypothetical protein [Cyanobium sp. LEGE 06143]MBE9173610.1 hypothetical protein [Cyanobium sp. LEGE 06143]
MEAQLARWQPGAEGQAVSVAIKVDIRPDQNIETSIEDAARSHDLVILRSQRRLVAGLPIPAGGRMGGLMRRLSISVLVISDPLH